MELQTVLFLENSGDADNAISLEYDGSSWTAGPNGNGVVPLSGHTMGAGTQTDALFAGGPPTNSCKYDGTTFTVGPALGTAQPANGQSSGPAGAGWIAHGSPVPSVGNKTQEFNSSANVITASSMGQHESTQPSSILSSSAGTGDTTAGMIGPGDTGGSFPGWPSRTLEFDGIIGQLVVIILQLETQSVLLEKHILHKWGLELT